MQQIHGVHCSWTQTGCCLADISVLNKHPVCGVCRGYGAFPPNHASAVTFPACLWAAVAARRALTDDVALAAPWSSWTTWINTFGSFSTRERRPPLHSNIFHSACVLYFGIFLTLSTHNESLVQNLMIEKSRKYWSAASAHYCISITFGRMESKRPAIDWQAILWVDGAQ